MNADTINKAFLQLLGQRAIGRKLGITANHVAQLRYRLDNNLPVSMEKKLALLQRSGWRQDDICYTTKDLVAVARFALNAGAAAKNHGPEYLVEKFLKKK